MWDSTMLLLYVCIGFMDLTSASHVNQRSDDTNPLEVAVSRLTEDVSRLQALLTQEVAALQGRILALEQAKAKKAAFRARLDSDPAANAPIHFNLVHSVGNGYDEVTGIYTVPYSGWYSFDFQVYPHVSSTDIYDLPLMVNGNAVIKGHCHNSDGASFTCNSGLTMHVNAGDRVWVQSTHTTAYWHAVFDNVFSGVLVIPDD